MDNRTSADPQVNDLAGNPPAAVHIDLDSAPHIYRVHRWAFDSSADPLFESGMTSVLDFLDNWNIRATLFSISEDLTCPRKKDFLREAVKRGHEIASHTHSHRPLTRLSQREKHREIWTSRERLADQLATEVVGFRAPAFDLDRETLEMIAEAGYRYDSSLFSDRKSAQKVRLDTVSPFPHRVLPGKDLLELPLPSYKPLPVPFHPCYSLVLGTGYFRAGLYRFRKKRAPLILLFHLTDFAQPLAGDFLPNRRAKFYTLSYLTASYKLARCNQIMEMVKRHYHLVSTRELLALSEHR